MQRLQLAISLGGELLRGCLPSETNQSLSSELLRSTTKADILPPLDSFDITHSLAARAAKKVGLKARIDVNITFSSSLSASLLLLSCLLTSCMEQYNPVPHWDKFEQERLIANRTMPTLTAEGKLPSQDAAEVDITAVVETKYQQFCSNCHGAQGQGDGIAGKALTPQPRDFSDSKWQQDTNDNHIYKVIAEGGDAVGLNNSMAAFAAILSPEEIKAMVEKIRKFKR